MSRKNNGGGGTRRRREEDVKEYSMLTRYATAIVLLAAGVLLLLSIFGAAGPVGTTVFTWSYAAVGIGSFLLPLALIAIGLYSGFGKPTLATLTTVGLTLTVASVLSFAGLFPNATFGGMAGTWLGGLLSGFFGFSVIFIIIRPAKSGGNQSGEKTKRPNFIAS